MKKLFKRKKFIIGGFIIVAAIGVLGFIAIRNSATFYYTVSEVLALPDLKPDQNIRVFGVIEEGSIEQKANDLSLKFTVTEGGKNLPVFYRGVVPDSFKPGADIVIEGNLGTDGIFIAKILMPKCPSKYEPVDNTAVAKGNS